VALLAGNRLFCLRPSGVLTGLTIYETFREAASRRGVPSSPAAVRSAPPIASHPGIGTTFRAA
jgi:hypothetical protein